MSTNQYQLDSSYLELNQPLSNAVNKGGITLHHSNSSWSGNVYGSIYQYQTQQASKSIVLSANKTVSGAITGNWSYDASKKILTIGTYKVKVQRGLDWEATPRTTTIIYSGLTDKGISLWGKKVK